MSETVATLRRANGDVIAKFELPRSAADVSLSRYISFLNEMKKFDLEDANPILIMAQAVGEFTGVDLADVLLAKVGENWAENRELDGGVRSLYGWIVKAVSNYKGTGRTKDGFEFEYNRHTYQIPFIVTAELAGSTPVVTPIETGDMVEAFETVRTLQRDITKERDIQKVRTKRIEQLRVAMVRSGDKTGDMEREIRRLEAEIELENDPNGSLLFLQYLRLVAILAKRPGEKLPAQDGDRERWIQERVMHLQEIDAKTALDVDFFLSGLLTYSKRTLGVTGSLILPLFALAAAIQSKQQPKGKPTIRRYRTNRKLKSGLAGVR